MINPLPEKLILDFAAKVDKLVVIEELDPIIENHCKQLGLTVTGKDVLPIEDEFSQNLIAEKLVNRHRLNFRLIILAHLPIKLLVFT